MLTTVSLPILATYVLIGMLAGMASGLFGLGGGIIIVPALLYLFILQQLPAPILMQMAVATSLATIVFTSLSSTYAHHRHGAVLWREVGRLVPGIILGGLLGAAIADHLPSDGLRIGFGLFELLVALQIWLDIKPAAHRELPGGGGMVFAGGGIGTLSTLLGIGGGTITIPFLLWCNIEIRHAIATSAACGLPIAVAGTAGMIYAGWDYQALPPGSTGYVYWPAAAAILVASVLTAPLGARLAHTLPVGVLKRVFAAVLAAVGLRMLV